MNQQINRNGQERKKISGFKILVKGVFYPEDLDISYINKDIEYSKKAVDFINRIVRTKVVDGKLFRVISYKTQDHKLSLVLGNTSYKYFIGSIDKRFISNFGLKKLANPLSVGAVIVTSDCRIVIGKRLSKLTINPGKYSTVAGMMDREKDFSNGKPDPFKAILRELYEEIGVEKRHVKEIVLLGLIYNEDYYQTYLPFYIKIDIPSNILKQQLKCQSIFTKEFERFIYLKLNEESIANFIVKNHKQISQTCLGNILLFGERVFGETWFKNLEMKLT